MEEFEVTKEKSAERVYIELSTTQTGIAIEWRAEFPNEFCITSHHMGSGCPVGAIGNVQQAQQLIDALTDMRDHVYRLEQEVFDPERGFTKCRWVHNHWEQVECT